jgi:hypothetical protein
MWYASVIGLAALSTHVTCLVRAQSVAIELGLSARSSNFTSTPSHRQLVTSEHYGFASSLSNLLDVYRLAI